MLCCLNYQKKKKKIAFTRNESEVFCLFLFI
jgi:hypothetical protein